MNPRPFHLAQKLTALVTWCALCTMKHKNVVNEQLALHYFVHFLHQDDVLLNDGQTLGNCGFTNQTARPQAPATVGLAFRLGGK